MKTSRRKARQNALQVLFQLDLNGELSTEQGILNFERHFTRDGGPGSVDEFTMNIARGVISKLVEIDAVLKEISEHWRLERMAAVDRNILRMGVFELRSCDDIPATVTINEMVELAKLFGSEDSPAFVNGVLDRARQTLNCPNKVP